MLRRRGAQPAIFYFQNEHPDMYRSLRPCAPCVSRACVPAPPVSFYPMLLRCLRRAQPLSDVEAGCFLVRDNDSTTGALVEGSAFTNGPILGGRADAALQ